MPDFGWLEVTLGYMVTCRVGTAYRVVQSTVSSLREPATTSVARREVQSA